MNRTALGLAIGAGYMLGRTKKLKMALAVGSVVAGKKLNLTPRAIGELLQQQLRDNPQFKEIGDQLRQDMRGVGKAATGAMAERQINALADRLHGRTADVRDRLSGVVPDGRSDDEESREDSGDDEPRDDADEAADDEDTSDGGRESRDDREDREDREDSEDEDTSGARRQERPRKKAAQKAPAKKSSAASTAKKTAAKAPAKKTGAARKTAAKKTASAGGGSRGGRSRQAKGGDDR
ncbi:DNA primase [Streptomyces collinus]|uniref:DNA primase n=1 Tax=Streptomyces collinus TaxID=42684 RepID=UPI003630FD1E